MNYSLPIRVYFEDTDAAGVVYHSNYLKFMERARSQWFIDQGMGMMSLMQTHSAVFVVSEVELRLRDSAKLEDLLDVTVRLQGLKKVSAVFDQEVFRDGQLICRGTVKVGCVHAISMKPVRIPADVSAALSSLDTRPLTP